MESCLFAGFKEIADGERLLDVQIKHKISYIGLSTLSILYTMPGALNGPSCAWLPKPQNRKPSLEAGL